MDGYRTGVVTPVDTQPGPGWMTAAAALRDEPDAPARRVIEPDDRAARAGLYGPDSEAWRLNREAMLLLGAGPRALLLQIAHPLVAEGVDQFSDFRLDPWRRLSATLRSYLTIVYGSRSAARAEIGLLNRLHRAIGGMSSPATSRPASTMSSTGMPWLPRCSLSAKRSLVA